MTLPIYLLAATLALVAFWVGLQFTPRAMRRPGLPTRPPLKYQQREILLHRIQRELERAGLRLSAARFLTGVCALAASGALLTLPFQNPLLILVTTGLFAAVPLQLLRSRRLARARAVTQAVGPALAALSKLLEVRQQPLLALTDLLPSAAPPLQAELRRALAEVGAGIPLPEALTAMAERAGNNFYLHQVAELTRLNLRTGGDLAGAIQRLADRFRMMEELRAEEKAELFGYSWLLWLLFVAALLPLPYWALSGAPAMQIWLHQPLAQGLLAWVIASGVAIASLPYWLALDEP
ncbi:MAG TPA: type II secretion system F family protein [Symbiobacteriaceae bacterium]|nr:type II secretion system F family protein [Symbiobacteriaceae bacterium]